MTPPAVLAPVSLDYLDPVPRRKTPRWLWAAALLGAVGAIGWASFAANGGTSGEPGPARAVADDRAEATALGLEPEPVPTLDEGADAVVGPERAGPTEPERVFVHVATDPSGAAVMLADGSSACETTPCSLETRPGETLVLRARLGKRKGRMAITPTTDQTVLIELKAPKKTATRPRAEPPPKRKRSRPSRSSDLKVPEWAQ